MEKKEVLESVGESLADAIQDEVKRRHEDPCGQMRFHTAMLAQLPKRAILRKMWHTMMQRRWKSYCLSSQKDQDHGNVG